MPWHVSSDHAGCDGFAVVKDDDDEVVGCHATREEANRQMAALYASEKMALVGAIKAAPAAATFEGWASTSALDRQGDVIEPSAFARSLPAFLDNGPIYWQHAEAYDPLAKPIGKAVDARIADAGLYITAQWAKTAEAEEVRQLVLDGIVSRLSVGFTPRQMHRDSALGHNVITDLDLLEVSVVAIPANDGARITVAKALDWLDHVHGDAPVVADATVARRRRRVITSLR